MTVQVRLLTDEGRIQECMRRFEELVGVRIPIAYLARGSTYGCFDERGTLVGGYTLVATPPFRGVVFLPDAVKENHWFFQNVSLNNVLEVNGVWLERGARLSAGDVYAFWWQLVRSMRRTKKRYVLVWYNANNRHLQRLYGRVKKEIIYKGQSQPNGRETTHAEICVAYTTRLKLSYSVLGHLPKILKLRLVRFWRRRMRRPRISPPRPSRDSVEGSGTA